MVQESKSLLSKILEKGTMGRLSMDIAMPVSGVDVGIFCMSLVFMYKIITILEMSYD